VQFLEDEITTRRTFNIIANAVNENVEKRTLHGEILEGLLQAPRKVAKNIKNTYNIFPIGYVAAQPVDENTGK
jgi:hypothetical protein